MKRINEEIEIIKVQIKTLTELEDTFIYIKKKMPAYRAIMAFAVVAIWLSSYITKVYLKADLYVPYWEMFLTMIVFLTWIFTEVRLITLTYMRLQVNQSMITSAINRLNENLERLNRE